MGPPARVPSLLRACMAGLGHPSSSGSLREKPPPPPRARRRCPRGGRDRLPQPRGGLVWPRRVPRKRHRHLGRSNQLRLPIVDGDLQGLHPLLHLRHRHRQRTSLVQVGSRRRNRAPAHEATAPFGTSFSRPRLPERQRVQGRPHLQEQGVYRSPEARRATDGRVGVELRRGSVTPARDVEQRGASDEREGSRGGDEREARCDGDEREARCGEEGPEYVLTGRWAAVIGAASSPRPRRRPP